MSQSEAQNETCADSSEDAQLVKRPPPQSWHNAKLPIESYGTCRRVQWCGNWSVELANGFCVDHWDAGRGD